MNQNDDSHDGDNDLRASHFVQVRSAISADDEKC